MAYSEKMAARIREALAGQKNIEEKKMFGGLCFMVNNKMCIGGTLVQEGTNFYKPSSTDGPLIYLNGNPDVQIFLDRIEEAGGKILVPKTAISDEYGDMAVFEDTEGNRIALHNVPAKYRQQ